MKQYPKEFIDGLSIDFGPVRLLPGSIELQRLMIVSINGLSVRVERSVNVRNQLMQREVALAGLFAAWNKQKEIEGK